VPFFICPNCKHRSVDDDGREGLTDNAVACSNCGFGFLFELMDDYYPGPNTGFVVCDQEGRVLAVGRGVFELTGYGDRELMGRDLVDGLHMNGFEPQQNPAKLALEWGVRRLDQRIGIKTRSGQPKRIVADFFPAYDSDGGLLVALSPD
jgi:PAS domain S-box-containing protein